MANIDSIKTKEDIDELFDHPDLIIEKANEYATKSFFPESEKEMPFYYFIIKHLSAVHQSRFGTIPVQIYNEHRMALDHLFRAKANNDASQIKSVVEHLCRAVLDMVKLNCDGLQEQINKKQSAVPKKALGLISNGDYIKSYNRNQNEAENALNSARCEEDKIGRDIEVNKKVINLFVRAYAAHYKWHKFQCENMGNALFISARYYTIKGWSLVVTSVIAFIVGYASNFVYNHSLTELIGKIFGK